MADDPQSPAAQQRMMRKVYHRDSKVHPHPVEMYQADAANAVTNHPKEWSYEPWGEDEPHEFAGVYLPPDWRDLPTQKRRALAMSLGAPSTVKANEADDFIATEAERREKLDAAEAERQERQTQDNKRAGGGGDRPGNDEPKIPENWRNRKKSDRIALAQELGADGDVTLDEADEYIQGEVARRTGTPGTEKTPL
jgi:hypothetical protein